MRTNITLLVLLAIRLNLKIETYCVKLYALPPPFGKDSYFFDKRNRFLAHFRTKKAVFAQKTAFFDFWFLSYFQRPHRVKNCYHADSGVGKDC